ncbi:hypothetical protein TPHA_0C03880 [Tetrapisispora phaffii CBS 4417]|uniref:Maintenance of telomere capping protein 2 n=1 Tax=Tetrapisispora phaffii (strain ATCC 24235 / CBS 4417 / NBRC 1672 / NRRL Y-8282 / UCD 70-5) TaxID=1071381 RepID=G8BQM7_TETPH|nr:hypothetical protein TPHA_0C03880 [Tetrapisispora phaffii CBS 4417]CCE62539.1 hypothetical protein TPHA_0C03880 [Tetrapisispora phaffii CBS 4417]
MDDKLKTLVAFRNILQFSIILRRSFVCIINEDQQNIDQTLLLKNSEIIETRIGEDYEGIDIEILDKFEIIPPVHRQRIKISIISNVEDLESKDQINLVRYLRAPGLNHIFIGLLYFDCTNARTKETIATQDWLRNSIWMSCVIKDMKHIEMYDELLSSGNNDTRYAKINLAQQRLLDDIHVDPRVKRYVLDVIVHLRMHTLSYKQKGGGIHPRSLEDVILLSKVIRLSQFAAVELKTSTNDPDVKKKTPTLYIMSEHIRLAALMYFPFHLILIRDSSMDVSVSYGSNKELIDDFIEKLHTINDAVDRQNPLLIQEIVIRDVLRKVIPPI